MTDHLQAQTELCRALEAIRGKRGEFESTAAMMVHGDSDLREEAARELRHHRPWCQAALLAALRDPEPRVRMAAAESLGFVGDHRAVKPLVDALDPGATAPLLAALTQPVNEIRGIRDVPALAIWLVPGTVAVAILAAEVSRWFLYGFYAALGLLLNWGVIAVSRRRVAGKQFSLALAEALARIVERERSTDLLASVPRLKNLSVRYEADTRNALWDMAHRIEKLTAAVKDLPISSAPSRAPSPDISSLPRASTAAAPDADALPRASAGDPGS